MSYSIEQLVEAIRNVGKTADAAASMARQQAAELQNLKKMSTGNGRPDIARIEAIPGRRVPYDLVLLIPIGANETTTQEAQHTVSQDGPFVAVKRYATFMSMYQFQVTTDSAVATFNGRSYGRYRPVSSTLDINDAMGGFSHPIGAAAPGTGLFSLVNSNQHSPFRTMEFDGTIEVETGSGYKRQSIGVPSSLWAPGWDMMQDLPVMDYHDRGDVITVRAKPNHVSNPAAGNIQTLVGALPYLDSQYDAHEGITYTTAVGSPTAADTITRQPDGILIVGFFGYKILGAPTMP